MKWGGGGQCYAWHGSCSAEYHEPPDSAQAFHSETEALAWARAEAEDMTILEGGITMVDEREQMAALLATIEDAARRLGNLRREGRQYPNWSEE